MTESPDAPKPGDVLAGKYQVERVLGIGGMGIVIAARHMELEERVAIKLMLPSAMAVPDAVARFVREARAAARLKSEHVARVTDVGKLETGAPYMVMEYLEGNDLGEVVLARGGLPVPEAIDYIVQACEALAEAHAGGIVHRDLKPANLFLAKRPGGAVMVKVLDFGISKVLNPSGGADSRMTGTSTVVGSPLYMSPEQLKSSRDVDSRADIWALGVTLYELLTGQVPYEAETMPLLCSRILTELPRPIADARKDLDPQLSAAVMHALVHDPSARYQTVAEMAHALAPFGSPRSLHFAERASMLLEGSLPVNSARAGSSASLVPTPAPAVISGSTALPQPSSPSLEGARPAAPIASHARTATSFGTSQARSPGVPRLAIAGGAVGLVLLGGILAVLLVSRSKPPVDPAAHVETVTREPASSATAPSTSATVDSVAPAPPSATPPPAAPPPSASSSTAKTPPAGKGKTAPAAPPARPAADDLYGARR